MAPSGSSPARAAYAPDPSKLRYAESYFTNARGKRMFHCAVFPASPEAVPLVFMGISFGTLVGLHTVLSGEHAFSAVVLARDAAFLEDYMTDPLNVTDNLTVRMGEQSSAAMEALAQDRRVEQPGSTFCALPLLIVQGSADKVTSVPLARKFFERIANRDKQFKEFAGLFHCIFNEPEKQDVLDHISQWLCEHMGGGGLEAVQSPSQLQRAKL
ncbi:hypothetical protein PybrP1_006868 [[Pythium] brassicae (nom. inval.)]|nr:hypothetical protein PybrP1_006868 [[Pythium] brassicae (nom. inval.)]